MATIKAKDIDEYIASFPKEIQKILEQIRVTIKKAAPDAEETISYAIPTFKLNGVYLVYFAAFKNHIGFYATPTGHEEFKEELSHFKQGKGSVQFPLNNPMPFDLITRIVKFRVQQNLGKLKEKAATKQKLKLTGSQEVTHFLTDLEHPLKKEIEELRKIILNANKGLTELIKWNAPSFSFKGDDRITMRIHPPKQIQLIFHRGAKVRQQPNDKLITDNSGILFWKTNDRAVATFTNMDSIKSNMADLIEIVNKWLKATTT